MIIHDLWVEHGGWHISGVIILLSSGPFCDLVSKFMAVVLPNEGESGKGIVDSAIRIKFKAGRKEGKKVLQIWQSRRKAVLCLPLNASSGLI